MLNAIHGHIGGIFENIRKHIDQTVIMGKGTHSSAAAAALEGEEAIPTTSSQTTWRNASELFQKCRTCVNNDQALFVMDRKNGRIGYAEYALESSTFAFHQVVTEVRWHLLQEQ